MSSKTDKTVEKAVSATNSADESKTNYVEPSNETERLKLGLERERFDLQKSIEISKLEIEKLKIERELKFWNRNLGVLITAAVSLAAVIVSLGQVWSTWISQNKQLQIVALQKEKELSLSDEQNKREWNLNAAKFITDNRKIIFEGSPQEQKLIAKVIQTIYPSDVALSLLEKIESASPPSEAGTWREAREKVVRPVGNVKRIVRPKVDQPADGANQTKSNDSVPQSSQSNANGSNNLNVPLIKLPGGGCRTSMVTNQMGDGKTYTCLLSEESADYCYYQCYPNQN
jgi:hypothetical protein